MPFSPCIILIVDISVMSISHKFYRSLLKSSLSLGERAKVAESLLDVVRDANSEKWKSIKSNYHNHNNILLQLKQSGFIQLSLPNSADIVSSIINLSSDQMVNSSLDCSSNNMFYLSGVDRLDPVKQLVEDQTLHDFVSLYLGAPASIYKILAWWQFPSHDGSPPSNAQLWHRDRDDFSFLKFFMYCTDVDLKSGPHAFLPQTHLPSALAKLFSCNDLNRSLVDGSSHQFLSDTELKQLGYTGTSKIWIGPAGTCFLEDTRGFHRAFVPTKKPRLIFSIVWTIGPGYDSL